jgi:hypothetical protein
MRKRLDGQTYSDIIYKPSKLTQEGIITDAKIIKPTRP